ncbi:phosphatidate cytidylyltransferase [Perkinsus olseni]|uniref:Phosphatidate cytidylyltransferase n=1 Tax=Perkinsus olseni TaxID=32597 RepID=A0A7J6LEY0_PEROL|nr:phosphatidate cytidylyltransferase [Perkinsus olseni]KAF4661842.1 phosphatidate cytidylyltransferase [Perkinsus olseni]
MPAKQPSSDHHATQPETPKVRRRRTRGEEVPSTGQSGKDLLSQTEPDDDSEWDSSRERPIQKHELLTRGERDERAAAGSSGGQQELSADKPMVSKMKNLRVRTFWAVIMISGFLLIVAMGHFYCSLLVLGIAAGMFQEICMLKRNKEKDLQLPLFYSLRWYLFFVTVFYGYKRFMTDRFDRLAMVYPSIHFIVKYHGVISYTLLVIGLVAFVLSLRKYTLRYQFGQLAWTIVTLIIVVVQGIAMTANIYNGLIWFFLPTSLVIVNDIFAYLFGFFFGHHPLIKLSPKKTWEGFIGGSVATMIFAIIWCSFLQKYEYFTCRQEEIVFKPFVYPHCTPDEIYTVYRTYTIPPFGMQLQLTDMQIHALVLGVFASLVAPFGGFLASGFKRAFKIKDFGDSIPGHGGLTDRFDCQVVMGMFTYVYLSNFVVADSAAAFTNLLEKVMQLSDTEQLQLFELLGDGLKSRGVVQG